MDLDDLYGRDLENIPDEMLKYLIGVEGAEQEIRKRKLEKIENARICSNTGE